MVEYQVNAVTGADELQFSIDGDISVNFDNAILKSIEITHVSFTEAKGSGFRFDIDSKIHFAESIATVGKIFSFDELRFQNIGLKFDISSPFPSFDLSSLIVLPKINFDGMSGFLSSFPLKFSQFTTFNFTKISATDLKIDFDFHMPGLEKFLQSTLVMLANSFLSFSTLTWVLLVISADSKH